MKIIRSLLYLLFGGMVFVLGLNLLKLLPENLQDVYKFAVPVLFLVLYFAAQKFFPDQKTVMWVFFLVSTGWLMDYYLTGKIARYFSLSSNQLSGMAFTMVISALVISAPVLIGWRLAGNRFSDIYLQGSHKIWGVILGSAGLLVFGGLGVLQAQSQGVAIKVIASAIPLVLLFGLANAFREELVYRAVFLKEYQANIGMAAAVIVTTIVFAAAHLEVSYSPSDVVIFSLVLVVLGVVGSLIMLKTKSLIGAVLFHAGADVLLIMGLLASGQLAIK